MELKKFAEMLNGREYQYPQFTRGEIQIAKDNGFVIVYGASDDLMEFDGAITDEVGCFDGGEAWFDGKRITDTPTTVYDMCIKALWCDDDIKDEKGGLITWTYKTDIPHETFMIYEDEDKYCRGIVFKIDSI